MSNAAGPDRSTPRGTGRPTISVASLPGWPDIPWPGPLRRLRDRWRQSVLFRVVATTLVLSVTVVTLVGVVLLDRVRAGLLDAKVASSISEANAGLQEAKNVVDASDQVQGPGAAQLVDQVAVRLASRAGSPGLYDVLLLAAPGSGTVAVPERGSSNVEESSIPANLRAEMSRKRVARDPSVAWTYTTIEYADGTSTPGIAVGAPFAVPGVGYYEIYYLFPLTSEESTLALVQRGILLAGLVLVALLCVIAWFVTRSVVNPVRMASRIAERFAAGRLEERMQVRGEDEIARLANAFNAMASSLKRQIRQLEDLSRVQRRFVSDVSHELRTPLTTIRMASEVIHDSRTELEAPSARAAELLVEQLDRFEDLLTELLEISRFDAGSAILDAESVDLRDLVARAVENATPLAVAKSTELRLTLDERPCMAEVDPLRIERVMRNLVTNAIEHGESRPVEVRVAADEQAVAVVVRDHGVGLRPGEAGLVFNRFWRSDPSRARTTGGTGLGLAISLEDVRLHGGWLEAWGEPGEGSVFRLTLPRTSAATLASAPLALEPPEVTARREAAADIGAPYRRTAPEGQRGEPRHAK